MTTESESFWTKIAGLLQHHDRRAPATPAEAQADYDAAGERPLSQEETSSIVRYMMRKDRKEETLPAGRTDSQDVAAYVTRLAAARRQSRLWQMVAASLAAALVVLAVLQPGSMQTPRAIHVEKVMLPSVVPANSRMDESPETAEFHSITRMQTLTSYLTLRQQVLQRGADALPVPNVQAEPVPPMTMEELLRTSS